MSQLKMQMPGATAPRAARMNIYTVLMLVAVAALGVAVGLMWQAASKVAPAASNPAMAPFGQQEPGSISLGR